MKTPSLRYFVVLVFGLLLAPSCSVAQNISSGIGVSGQDRDRLTLLPGPSLLSPGRGFTRPQADPAGPVALSIVRESSPSLTFLSRRNQSRPAPSPLRLVPLRPAGVQPMNFESPVPPATPLARPTPALPPPGELRFDAKLPPPPAPVGQRT